MEISDEDFTTMIREIVLKTIDETPVPVKIPATVVSIDGGTILVHVDGDPDDTVVPAEPLVAVPYAATDRVMVEFHPPHACFVVGEIGSRDDRFDPTVPAFNLESTVNQTIPTATQTDVTFDQENVDTDDGHSGSAAIYTIPTAGLWAIGAALAWTGNATGLRFIAFHHNATELAGDSRAPASSSPTQQSIHEERVFAAGDTVKVVVTQTSGIGLDVIGNQTWSALFYGHWIRAV